MNKALLYFIMCFNVITSGTYAQTWIPVGSPRFSPGAAMYTSIAIGPAGIPYVVYSDSMHGYAATMVKYTGGSWVNVGSADFSAGEADYISMAIDGSGSPYVMYTDWADAAKATVMKYNGSSWVTVGTAGFSDAMAVFTSIAIDNSGTPYVAYADYFRSAKATVKKYNGSAWVTVGSAGFSAGGANYASIAINSAGVPYVVYADTAQANNAVVMKFDGTNWVQLDTVFSGSSAEFTSIVIGPGDTPYVAFADYSFLGSPTVMKFNGSKWVAVGSRGLSGSASGYVSMALDPSAATPTPYIAYQDYLDRGKATVKKYDGSSWVAAGNPDISDSSAYYTSIAIDSSGIPYLAYCDQDNRPFAYGPVTVMKLNPTPLKNDVVATDNITLFPNPVTSMLSITSPDRITNVSITNLIGQTVYRNYYYTEKVQVDVSGLPTGIYLVRINGTGVRKFVKQ